MNSHRQGVWLGSPNCTPQRQGARVQFIVLHTMDGTIGSANARFQNNSVGMQSRASAHYGVGGDGRVVQWVDEADGSWANGDWNMNMESVAIEHEDMGEYNAPRPDALYEASSLLVAGICLRYGIPVDRQHILDHRQVSSTSCPDALDTDRIVRRATAIHPVIATTSGDDDMPQLIHRNGTAHWAYIENQKVMHGAWGGTQPEMVQVSNGTAVAIRAFFQQPNGDNLVLVVESPDGAEYYEGTSSPNADLTSDTKTVWARR